MERREGQQLPDAIASRPYELRAAWVGGEGGLVAHAYAIYLCMSSCGYSICMSLCVVLRFLKGITMITHPATTCTMTIELPRRRRNILPRVYLVFTFFD